MSKFLSAFLATLLLSAIELGAPRKESEQPVLKIGVVGLDTGHAPDYSEVINTAAHDDPIFGGTRVVTAFHPFEEDKVEKNLQRMSELDIEIVGSLEDLLAAVDAVMLHATDGRRRLQLALRIMQSGKPLWMNKPVAHELADVIAIYRTAQQLNVPVFSASSLRYVPHAIEIRNGKYGPVLGATAYSPAHLDERHVDFFWYGIHGVETLFTVMGPGCRNVVRTHIGSTDVITGVWEDGRVGTVRGGRNWRSGGARRYGGVVWCEQDIVAIGPFAGYAHLVKEIVRFFRTGSSPVEANETIEIYAFMQAADRSKNEAGVPIDLAVVMEEHSRKADVRLSEAEAQILVGYGP